MIELLVIGGGPGGYVAAIRARQLGMTVVLAEKEALGGTCLNRGCIPTKAYYKNAEVLRTLQRLEEYNVTGGSFQFDMSGARLRKEQIVSKLVSSVENLLKANGVEVIRGKAFIRDASTVMIGEQEIKCRRILIAAGSEPFLLPIPGTDLPGVVSSNELLAVDQVPERLVIIGGGVIGMEFACIFNAFGSKVTVYEYAPGILSTLDGELVKRMNVFLKRQGIEVQTSAQVQKIEALNGNLQVTAQSKKGMLQSDADRVLLAVGRKAAIQDLALAELGIIMDKGFIWVNENYETSVAGIYAIGDVTGGQMLAHVASEEGITAVERMAGLNSQVHYHAVPACIFTFPEIATVGMTEEQAGQEGIPYRTGKSQFAANGKAITLGETDGLVKVIADPDNTIIGVHILGPHASDLILEATMIVKNQMKIEEIKGTIHPHPTLGETLQEAIADIKGEAIHLMPKK